MQKLWVGALGAAIGIVTACSGTTSPDTTLTLAPTYHLQSIDGKAVPFVNAVGSPVDSGTLTRLSGDTVATEQFGTVRSSGGNPSVTKIGRAIYRAVQTGNTVVLLPVIAFATDTATVSGGTLTVRAYDSGVLQVAVYAAP
jgi:hypothetical protein